MKESRKMSHRRGGLDCLEAPEEEKEEEMKHARSVNSCGSWWLKVPKIPLPMGVGFTQGSSLCGFHHTLSEGFQVFSECRRAWVESSKRLTVT